MASLASALGDLVSSSPALAVAVAFAGGLVSAFSPCAVATAPLVIAYIGGGHARSDSDYDQRRTLACSLAFSAGLAAMLTTLGAIAALVGRIVGGFGQRWYLALGSFTVVLGLWLAGAIEIPVRWPSPRTRFRPGGLLGAFALGVLSGAFSSPCATPVLAAVLAIVAGRADLAFGISLLGAYSVGHAMLALIAGVSLGFVNRLARSERTRRAGAMARRAYGILVILIGVYLLYIGA